MRQSIRVTLLCILALLVIASLVSAQTTQSRINNLVNAGISGSVLQNLVASRANGIAPWNRPYVFDGVGDCYGYTRQVWNAILFDGSAHTEDYYPNAYNKSRWIGVVGGLPVGTGPNDPTWGPISEIGGRAGLLRGDVCGTTQGHTWGDSVHYGIADTGGVNCWQCGGGYNGAYYTPYYGWNYYYRPIHAALAYTPVRYTGWAGMARNSTNNGYWCVKQNGSIYSFGAAPYYGGSNNIQHQPIVDLKSTSNGGGYWQLASDGGIFNYGNAGFYGSMGGQHLNAPMVGMAATSNNAGYWLVGADGGMFCFGNAPFEGSMGGQHLNAAIVGMAATSTNNGYWLVGADGGIFAFGDAPFKGSMGGQPMNAPIVDMARTPSNQGYWLVGADGGIFAFGDAPFEGSLGSLHLNQPICKIVATTTGQGYWLFAKDGGVFSFGDAVFCGSPVGMP